MARRDVKKHPDGAGSGGGGPSRAYVDTHYFLSLIFKDDAAAAARQLLYTLRGHGYHVLVPQTVLGEITAKIMEKSRPGELLTNLQVYHGILSQYGIDYTCLLGVSRDAPRHMSYLQENDVWLDPNDMLIVSQVLADPDSKFFFTADGKIRRSIAIRDYESRLRDAGDRNTKLKIRESLD